MKTSQWIGALAGLVCVVFLVTFFSNYLSSPSGDDQPGTTKDDELPTLTFPIRVYPYLTKNDWMVSRLEQEHHVPGHQDYWFENTSDQKVRLGGVSKSCKCQGIEVFVLPAGYDARFPAPPPIPPLGLGVGSVGFRGLLKANEDRESTRDLEAVAESHVVLSPDDPAAVAEVPPHRAGWVRMNWTGEKLGKMILSAKLWMHHPGSGLTVDLERQAWFVDPVRVAAAEVSGGTVKPSELPRLLYLVVWSSTRDAFKITKAEVLRPAGLVPSADAFEVGRPILMTTDDCVHEQVRMAAQGRVRSGYRLPVTLRKLAADGKTPFELGNFRRQVRIATDAADEPLFVAFTGRVVGDVQVSGVDDGGGVSFGTFPRANSPTRSVLLRSDEPGIQMEVDKARVPEYIRATLTDESTPGGLGKTWKLDLSVLPTAYGPFPRDDDPTYRDSAVYVRSTGPSPQVVRVSVRGDAVDR